MCPPPKLCNFHSYSKMTPHTRFGGKTLLVMFFVVSGEHQPSMSNDSDTSLIMPVELVLSDVELQSDPEQDDVKS